MNFLRFRSNFSSIYAGILAFTILVITIIWLALVFYLHKAQQREIAQVMQANANLARAFEEHTLRTVKQIDQLVLLVRAQYQRLGAKLDLAQFVHEAGANPDLVVIVAVLDERGDPVITNTSAPRANVADRDHFKFHSQYDSGKLFIGKSVMGRLGGRWLMPMSRRINKPDGSFGGAVSIGVDPLYFSNFYRDIDLGKDGVATLGGQDGFIRSRLSGGEPGAGQDVRNTRIVNAIERSPQGSLIFTSIVDNINRIWSYRALRDYPLYVAVAVSKEEALVKYHHLRRASYIAAGCVTLLILAFCGWLLRLEVLARARQAKIGTLNAQLRLANEVLEHRVAQRTTELEMVNSNLRAREAHYRAVSQSANDAIVTGDGAGNIVNWNRGAENIFGYTEAEVIGQALTLLIPSRYQDRHLAGMRRVLSGGEPHIIGRTVELAGLRKDESEFPLELSLARWETVEGQFLTAIIRDITERKKAEEAQAHLAAIVEDATVAIFTRTLDGTILTWNAGAEKMLGYTAAEVIGKPIGIMLPPEQQLKVARNSERLLRGEAVARETICLTKDGRVIDVLASLSPILDSAGNIVGASAIWQEITERKRLEKAYLQAQKLESLGTLAGGIAHDFNNILAAIRGNADLAAQDVGPDHIAARSLEEIRKASTRASELVRRIMAFGRPQEAKHEVVDLSAVTGEVLKLLRSTLPAGIVLNKDFVKDTPHALADAGQVHEAIVNLTTNAAHSIGFRAGVIAYRLEPVQVEEELGRGIPGLKAGRYARLTVSDSGCGMDAAILERIFDAFYTTKPQGEGTGLGLSMVHGIMRSHGGAVTVDSTPGKGSNFHLYFPVAAEHAVKERGASAAARSLPAARRVLYVDDEEALVLLAERFLARMGHQVSGFTDPEAALDEFRAHPQDYDVVVTDLSMPKLSGFEVAREVLAVRPGMPVLMTTGYVRAEDEGTARDIGIRELVLKPATMDELVRVLDRLFRNSELDGKALG